MLYNAKKGRDILEKELEKTYKIYTDASFDNETKVGTYSIIIMQEERILRRVMKKCKIQFQNSTECEIFAIFQAFNIINGGILRKDKAQRFHFKTDCSTARDFFVEEQYEEVFFKDNLELLNTIRKTHKSIKKRLAKKDCSLQIKWIPRQYNRIAHNCSYSTFRRVKENKSNKDIVLIEKEAFLVILQKFSLMQYRIMAYLINNADKENLVLKTQSEMAEILKISLSTLNKIINEFMQLGIISKISNGRYNLLI